MARVVFLGTASAVAYEGHQNTHLVVEGDEHIILIDCVGNPVLRLQQIGIHFNDLTDLMITHFHPDHVSGLPLLLMNMWLLGRERPLCVYGSPHSMSRIEKMMNLFDWEEWPDMFPVVLHRLPMNEMTQALKSDDIQIFTSPVEHLIPTLGLRIEFTTKDFVIGYSCDTDPCPQTVDLASDGDILIHEAAGALDGHSSPAEAGEIAQKAGVNKLYLIHYSLYEQDVQTMLEEARKTFSGEVIVAEDFMEIAVPE
jgi:ribonuclease Z